MVSFAIKQNGCHFKMSQIEHLGYCAITFALSNQRMWDMSALIRRCENFGHSYSFCSQLAEASERQT